MYLKNMKLTFDHAGFEVRGRFVLGLSLLLPGCLLLAMVSSIMAETRKSLCFFSLAFFLFG
jgi:hypothetical protein